LCPSLQLLGGILDVNSSYVSVVDELGLSQCFFDFLTLDHPNNNVHNIRLCRQLALSGCISTQQLLQLRAADKVGGFDCRERERMALSDRIHVAQGLRKAGKEGQRLSAPV
jgi:hypothetical protein